jgi:hypothetical protein
MGGESVVAMEFTFLKQPREAEVRSSTRAPDCFKRTSDRDRGNFRRRRHRLCGLGSSPGKRPDDRHEAQKALL